MSSKLLLIGDVHAVYSELDDCRSLIEYIRKLVEEHNATPVFMGDQTNDHSILHLGVQEFWREAFSDLSTTVGEFGRVIVLVGNHDQAGTNAIQETSMDMFNEGNVYVVNKVTAFDDIPGAVFMPYMASRKGFVDTVRKHENPCPGNIYFCHQTFDGSKYENGFYAKDGVDPRLFPNATFISGHIHTPQRFGNVWYIGAPRWRSAMDADVDRHLWLVEVDAPAPAILNPKGIPTDTVCRAIRSVTLTPDDDLPTLDDRTTWRVDLRGPEAWLEGVAKKYRRPGVKLRTFKTDKKDIKVRESEGIDKAFQSYVQAFVPPHGTPTDELRQMAAERIGM